MKSTSILGKHFAVRACTAILACAGLLPVAVRAQAVFQVPTSNRVAGNTVSGYNKDFGSATSTDLSSPNFTAFDAAGNLYISDTGNNCVRKVDSSGTMTVLAGYEATAVSTDTCAAAGLNITPTQGLLAPKGIAVDPAGDVFIADSGHNCVRQLPASTTGSRNLTPLIDTCTNYGSTAANLLSLAPSPTGLIIDPANGVIVSIADAADNINQVIYHYAANPANVVCDLAGKTSAAVFNPCPFFNGLSYRLNSPGGLARDVANNYYLADTGNGCVRKLTTDYNASALLGICASDNAGTIAIPNFAPAGVTIGAQGYVYVSNGNPSTPTVLQYTGTGSPTVYAGMSAPSTTYTGAQEGIPAVDVSLNMPTGLSVDPSGNVYIADTGNGIVRQLALSNNFGSTPVHTVGLAQTLEFQINSPVTLTSSPGTDFLLTNGNNSCNGQLAPSATATPTTCSLTLRFDPNFPGALRSPISLTDTGTGTVYAFGLYGTGLGANALFIPGTINTKLGSLNTPTAVIADTAGDLYYAEAGSVAGSGDIQVLRAGNTTPSIVAAAGGIIKSPVALALDTAQNLYVADNVANAIFRIDANGVITTVASGLSDPVALVVDVVGNLYVAEDGAGAVGVYKIYSGGQQVLIAGQGTDPAPDNVPATTAQFVQPSGLYMDTNGFLYVSDQGAYRVYFIDPSGTIHFFAGNGTTTTTAPLTPLGTGLQGPSGLIGDAAGDIYIADGPANLTYVVFGGSNQNPGIKALVGTGTSGSAGDGGPANLAELNNPVSVALDGSDDLYLVDAGNTRLREVNYQDPTLIFPQTKPLTTSAPLSTQLWDSGNQNLAPLSSFQPQDLVDFALESSGCGQSLLTGSTCELSYTFTPAAYGNYTSLALSNDNAVDNPQIVTLIGTSPQPVLSTPPVTATYGVAYTLAATITAASPAAAPGGTISFAIGNQVLCAAAAVPVNGVVTCSPSPTLENAGPYAVTVAYSGDSNYTAINQTLDLTINPAPVTITAANATRPYNTPNPVFTGTVASTYPFPAGQSITATYATTAIQTSAPGTYPITPAAVAGSGTLLSNYAITLVNGTLTITQNSGGVSITSPAVTAVYGTAYSLASQISSQQSPAPTGTATFTIGGQSICPAGTLSGGTVSCAPSPTLENVGTYSVLVSYSGDAYYPAATSTIALTISPAPVTITAANTSRQFNTPNPAFTGTITGVVTGQSITATYATTAVLPSPPGNYPITPTAVIGAGTLASNYTITLVPGVLTITQDASTINFSSPSVSAVYGTAYSLGVSITSGQTPEPTGSVTFTIGGQPICPTASLAANGTAACLPSPTLENTGSYAVVVTYSGDTNYLAQTASLGLAITPAPVTIKADNKTRPFNTPNPVFTGTVTSTYPFPVGQSITAAYTAPTATQASVPGTYPIVPAPVAGPGTLLANYSVTPVQGTLTITAPFGAPAITALPVNVVYGTAYTLSASITSTQTPAPTGTVSFTLGGQPVCPTVTLAANSSASCAPSPTLENAGSYPVTVTYSGDTHYPANTASIALSITPDPVTITATNKTMVVGTPVPAFTGTVGAVVAGQSITETFSSPAGTTPSVGNYPIVPAAVAGPGTLLANYAITPANGILTVTPPAITSPVGSFTLTATPPEQEIDLSGNVNFPLTLTSVKNFTDAVTFSCSGLPEGATCSFAPASVAPAANASSSSVMTITASSDDTNVPPGSFGALHAVPAPGLPPSTIVWAWTMLPIGFSGSAASLLMGRRRQKKGARRVALWLVPLCLLLAGLSGCGASKNFKIYTVTITATDSTYAVPVAQSTSVQLVLAR